MPNIFLLLRAVHDTVHDFSMKNNYSEPKIFTGGFDISSWSKLASNEKKQALNKPWYVYYSFRNPETGRLVRQTNIKGDVNRYKDKRTRLHLLKVLKQSLEIVLREGFNPYKDNTTLVEHLEERINGNLEKETVRNSQPVKITKKALTPELVEKSLNIITIKEAFKQALGLKQHMMSPNSFVRYKSRITRFEKWLLLNNYQKDHDIKTITKKTVIQYLNAILLDSSTRNRNNSRSDIASFFQTLEDNDMINENFVKKINVLKSVPERNKTYTPQQLETVFNYLKTNDPLLLLFVQFVFYNALRPIEVCRLKIGDLDIDDKKIYVRAKNQPVKTKIIPDILLETIPDLSKFKKEDFLFTTDKIGGSWDASDNNKRDFFTKRFKKVKDSLALTVDYGLYSFRHTFITKLYREMIKTASPFEVKSNLMLITGHSTMTALEKYLRDIDAHLPDDYSQLLK